jgi:predicted DCC family thiol-disulfide oxidoreductase YuxK
MSAANGPVLLFDGVCNLCSGTVQFVIERDSSAKVSFASLQSDFATEVKHTHSIPTGYLDSIILLEGDRISYKSTAALRLTKYLDGLWPLLRILLIIPNPVRNLIYDVVARNRYKWFGKKESCWVPTPELRARFKGV